MSLTNSLGFIGKPSVWFGKNACRTVSGLLTGCPTSVARPICRERLLVEFDEWSGCWDRVRCPSQIEFPSLLPAFGIHGGLLWIMNSAIEPASAFHRGTSRTSNRKGQLQQAGTPRPLRVSIELSPVTVLHHERHLPLKYGIRTAPYRRAMLRGTPMEINQIASHDLPQFARRANVGRKSGT
jgi:hypothetical protein